MARHIDRLISERHRHPNPGPLERTLRKAFMYGAPWDELCNILAQSGVLLPRWGGTEVTELLIAREILSMFTDPGPSWVAYRGGFEAIDAEETIAGVRRRCLAADETIRSSTFNIMKDSWEIYVALEDRDSPAERRGLAVEIQNPFAFQDVERALARHELLRGRTPPKDAVTHSLKLPVLLGEIWQTVAGPKPCGPPRPSRPGRRTRRPRRLRGG